MGLTVSVNGGAAVSVSGNGVANLGSLTSGSPYTISIKSSPVNPSETCSIANGSGTATANVSDIAINCTTANTTPASTQVTLDATVSQNVIGRIVTLQSPSGTGNLGAWLPIDTTGASGQSLILATDANGDIVLAAVTNGPATVLSADSTALALVRLSAGPLPDATTGAQADAAIRTSTSFAPLVAAVGAALAADTSPSTDSTVLADVVAVLNSGSAITAAKISRQIHAIQTPYLTGAPFTLVSGILSVKVSGSGGGALLVTNNMPIPWTVSTSAAAGGSLTASGGQAVPASGSATVPGSTSGLDLTINQSDDQKQEVMLEISSSIVETAFDFIGASPAATCTDSLVKSDLSTKVKALFNSGDTWTQTSVKLKGLFSASNVVDAVAKCIPATSTGAAAFFKEIFEVASQVLTVKDLVVHGGNAVVLGSFEGLYWGTNQPYGICEDSVGDVVNCATSYAFNPASLYLAPGAVADFTLTAQAQSGPMGLPGGLIFSPPQASLFTLDPVAMTVTATTDAAAVISGGGTPVMVTVSDQATTATGTISVEVSYPYLTVNGQPFPQPNPSTATLVIGSGNTLLLSLTDVSGNALQIPPNSVSWSTSDPTYAILTPVVTPGDTGSTLWGTTSSAVPGTVTIGVTGPGGTPWGTAVITVQNPPATQGSCVPPAGATDCAITLYDIPDANHSGFVPPVPGTITTVQTTTPGSTTTTVNNQGSLGVTIYDNVNGPPLSTPPCLQNPNGTAGCPPLNYHNFELCAVDGKWKPVTYQSVVSFQVALLSNTTTTCTGQAEETDIVTGYSLAADGTLTGTDKSTDTANYTCTTTSFGLTTVTTTTIQNAKHDVIVTNLKDGSGNATVNENRLESVSGSGGFTETTTVSGTQSWQAESVSPPQFPNTGIVATATSVPAGQALPQSCTVGTP